MAAWVLIVLLVWVPIAITVAVACGIRIADERGAPWPSLLTTDRPIVFPRWQETSHR
ncbi:hypothetical protein [Geodermatophilus sp. DF01-2]|uniref:hypothetical protein n=1 Tax=Geodermatophilus sp. DF01-2 TaxID=2559610 RepID=UPI001430CE82|nr:hypothetical protein [Geodermatophilus sp. DF01_2]